MKLNNHNNLYLSYTNKSLPVSDGGAAASTALFVDNGVGLPQPNIPNWTFDGVNVVPVVFQIVMSNC